MKEDRYAKDQSEGDALVAFKEQIEIASPGGMCGEFHFLTQEEFMLGEKAGYFAYCGAPLI